MTQANKSIWRTIIAVLVIVATAGAVYGYRTNWHFLVKPCSAPIQYSIGTFDSKFGISQQDFLKDIDQAVQIWEKAANKNLFEYAPNGRMKINLVYDSRQQATDKLKSLGIKIGNSKSSYDSLKAQYNSATASYNALKAQMDATIAQYNTQKQAYEAQVAYWNSRGGAPSGEYQKLNAQAKDLNTQAASINQKKDQINQLVDKINALANALNGLAAQLNLNAATYNTIGQARGEEFVEGVYVADSSGQHIDIYEFNDQQQLTRLLSHEFGHSLGLEHVDDPTAIMYRLNEGASEGGSKTPTAADLAELNQVCKLNK